MQKKKKLTDLKNVGFTKKSSAVELESKHHLCTVQDIFIRVITQNL